jgi:hypothetical protein
MKRTDLTDTSIRVLRDPKLDFMKRYSVLTEDDPRWSLSLLVFCTDGKIQKHHKNIEPSQVQQLVTNCLDVLQKEKK